MSLFQIVCLGFLAAVAETQETQNCSVSTSPVAVGNTEDAAALATSLQCSNGEFAVEWIGEVVVEGTIRVTGGTSLNITGAGSGAIADGRDTAQLFFVDGGSSLHLSDMTLTNGIASNGGAIFADQSSVSFSGDTVFSYNSANERGGAIYATDSSTVSWHGDGTNFSYNNAFIDGGAIYATNSSTVSWDGNGTHFSSNSARWGGAIYAELISTVSWNGDATQFSSNSATFVSTSTASLSGSGGAIYASVSSTIYWNGHGTQFSSNSASGAGGAIFVDISSSVSWDGDSAQFSFNSADEYGGAICAAYSTVSWDGDGTRFSWNYAKLQGGAMWVSDEGASSSSTPASVSWYGSTAFNSNVAGEDGGAVAMIFLSVNEYDLTGATFSENSASNGGALYLWNSNGLIFTNVTFQNNSASGVGGAVAVYGPQYETGILDGTATEAEGLLVIFSRCTFSDNKAGKAGGAVMTLAGKREFSSCVFEDNLADIGGAMRLGGTVDIHQCSFLSNLAYTRGLAIDAVGSANISGSMFDGNELYCARGSYRHDTEEEGLTARFEAVCLDCPDWDECSGCSITGNVTSTCETPLEHTEANEPGVTLETLDVYAGYWRTTNNSDNILACYNPGACTGGQTGEASYCASGYKGPYCAVCETDYSPSFGHTCTRCSSSRRQGLVVAAVLAALVAVFAVVTTFKFLLAKEAEEGNIGCFRRRVIRAVPVQALKIIVVVWQILTQFADAASVSYPGVYQDFLSVFDVVNFDLGSVLAAGCLWSGVDFHGRLLISTLVPLVVVGVLVMTYLIAVRRNGASSDAAALENIRHKHQTALLLLTFLVYSSVSSMVFQTFACETLDDDIEYLRADYRIHCTDAKHKAFEVYARFMVFVYPVGIPLLYAVLLFQRRDVLADAGADKTVAQPISGLWEAYRPERFYYEVVECGRRILLTGVVVFIFPNTAAQIAITIIIAFFFFAVFEMLSPYTSESDMWLSRGGHVIVFLSMFDLLLLKVDVSGERDQSQAAFAGVLVAGHVLMVGVILVEVVGVCYASRKKKVVEGEEASERPRVGSDDASVFESPPASWRSFLRQGSVSEKTGPTRSVSGAVVTTGGP